MLGQRASALSGLCGEVRVCVKVPALPTWAFVSEVHPGKVDPSCGTPCSLHSFVAFALPRALLEHFKAALHSRSWLEAKFKSSVCGSQVTVHCHSLHFPWTKRVTSVTNLQAFQLDPFVVHLMALLLPGFLHSECCFTDRWFVLALHLSS